MQNAKRHILYINADRGIPVWGQSGGSAHIRDFTEAAIQNDTQVTIVSARCQDGDDTTPLAKVHKIKFKRYGASFHNHWKRCEKDDVAKELRSFYANTVLSQQLPDMAQKNDFTLVYERYSLFSFAGKAFASSHKLPFVLEVNSPLIEEALEHRHLHLRELAESISKYLFTNADCIIAVSTEVAEYVRRIAPKANVVVMPNAVNPARLDNLETLDSQESDTSTTPTISLSHLKDKFVVGYLGSLRPWHGLNNLIQAFSMFATKEKNAHLLIVGDGKNVRPQLEQTCKELGISDQVTFTGEAPNSEVPNYLAHCDTVVAPYPALDNFYFSPLKIFEYMASRKPIIASDIGQISELLTNNVSALLVTPGDIPDLVTAMNRIYSNQELASQLANRAFDCARESHSWDVRMKEITNIFDELQSQPPVKRVV